jgi:hypothetical protein
MRQEVVGDDSMNVTSGCYSVAVSSPGGMARQYRVQYHRAADEEWRMYATFRTRELAEDCVKRLRKRGFESRIVTYAICPTAV